MPALLDELDTTLTRQAKVAAVSDGGRSADKPLPFHVQASRVLGDLRVYLVGWVKSGKLTNHGTTRQIWLSVTEVMDVPRSVSR